jgi:hypothetical protein
VENSPGVSHDNFVPTEAHGIRGPNGDPTRVVVIEEGDGTNLSWKTPLEFPTTTLSLQRPKG